MKKIILLAAILTVAAWGCGSKTGIDKSGLNACMADAPAWVIQGSAEGGVSAVGAAKISKAGFNFSRTEALANGRDEIARILAVKVNNMFKNFTQSTGIGDDETIDKVSANVSKQVASQMISGSKQLNLWVAPSPCDEIYVLVGVDSALAQQAVKDQALSSFRNEQALWQQFQAKKAQEELDAAVQAEFGANKAQMQQQMQQQNQQ